MSNKKTLSIYLFIIASISNFPVNACPFCSTLTGASLRAALLRPPFSLVLTLIITIFLIFIVTSILVSYLLACKINKKISSSSRASNFQSFAVKRTNYFIVAGMLLGGSIAGFVDGIVFHQILQWHSMIANQIPLTSLLNIEINMFWDGIFHGFVLLILLISLGLFWVNIKQLPIRPSTLALIGSLLMGAGLFNLIEGLIDHHLFQLHHVIQIATPNTKFYADGIFLVVAMVFIALGNFLLQKNIRKTYI